MPANVEIKARVADIDALTTRVKEISGDAGTVINQCDTFFNAPNCRLKLRQLQDQPSQLVFYKRSDQAGPKFSDYHITTTDDPDSLRTTLSKALGVKGEVKKKRVLYMAGQTRVHVDTVEGLGDYMELEVVLRDDQTASDGETIANDLMSKLNIQPEELIEGAYMDLLLSKAGK